MKNLDESQDEDAFLAGIFRQLEAIQPGIPIEQEATTAERKPPVRVAPSPGYLDPKNDPDVTWDKVHVTRYDKARAKQREAEAKRDAILALPDPTASDRQRLVVQERRVADAKAAVQRALTDHQQRLDEIDRYRQTDEGKARRNSERRNVRDRPNAKLSAMTPEQQAQHKQDEAWKRQTLSRLRASGLSDVQVQAELVVRLNSRMAKRAGQVQADAEESAMKNLPHYGQF